MRKQPFHFWLVSLVMSIAIFCFSPNSFHQGDLGCDYVVSGIFGVFVTSLIYGMFAEDIGLPGYFD